MWFNFEYEENSHQESGFFNLPVHSTDNLLEEGYRFLQHELFDHKMEEWEIKDYLRLSVNKVKRRLISLQVLSFEEYNRLQGWEEIVDKVLPMFVVYDHYTITSIKPCIER